MVQDLVALTKPRVTLMVMATALAGIALSPAGPGAMPALLAVVGIAAVVGSANALNCWMERDTDALMERTRRRPLAAGRLDERLGLAFGLGLGVAGSLLLAACANLLTAGLGLFALVTYVWVYTPLKRVSPIALPIGAIPGAMPPLLGWTAAAGSLDAPGLALFGLVFLWQVPHFLAIALLRREEYAAAGLRVLTVARGDRASRDWAVGTALALLVGTVVLAPIAGAGSLALGVAVALSGGLLGVSLWTRIEVSRRSARALLFASLAWLPLVLVVLVA